jgi:hypothetical protein
MQRNFISTPILRFGRKSKNKPGKIATSGWCFAAAGPCAFYPGYLMTLQVIAKAKGPRDDADQ